MQILSWGVQTLHQVDHFDANHLECSANKALPLGFLHYVCAKKYFVDYRNVIRLIHLTLVI